MPQFEIGVIMIVSLTTFCQALIMYLLNLLSLSRKKYGSTPLPVVPVQKCIQGSFSGYACFWSCQRNLSIAATYIGNSVLSYPGWQELFQHSAMPKERKKVVAIFSLQLTYFKSYHRKTNIHRSLVRPMHPNPQCPAGAVR